MTNTNMAIRSALSLSRTSSTELIKPFPSIKDDIQLQKLITESERIGIELEKHLPITCIQTPLGEFIDPREVYLQLAAQQQQSRELVVSKTALKLLEEYTENVGKEDPYKAIERAGGDPDKVRSMVEKPRGIGDIAPMIFRRTN